MKYERVEGQIDPQEKTTFKKPSLIWVKQTKFFRKYILASQKSKINHIYGNFVGSNVTLKFLKIYVIWRCFLKNPEFFINKRHRQIFFIFELRAVELVICFY